MRPLTTGNAATSATEAAVSAADELARGQEDTRRTVAS